MVKSLEEFTINGSELSFRYKKIKPTKVISLLTQLSKDSFETTTETYDFILENTEVKVNDRWLQIKDGEVFYPPQLEDDFIVLKNIVMHFISEYLTPVFTKSAE